MRMMTMIPYFYILFLISKEQRSYSAHFSIESLVSFNNIEHSAYSDSSRRFLWRIPLITWRSSTSASLDFNLHERNQTIVTTPMMLMTQTQIGMSIVSSQIGGRISMSTSPVGIPMQPSLAPSATISSSSPGGSGSGRLTFPDSSVTMQEPQLPLVQFVGMSTFAA